MNRYPIVFYNVENLFDIYDDPNNPGDDEYTPYGNMEWDEDRYREKLHKIAEALTLGKNGLPLIIGLSEVENANVLKDLIQTKPLNQNTYSFHHIEMNDPRGMDLAFIYDKKQFEITDTKRIPITLSIQPYWSTRDIMYVKGKVEGTRIIHTFINHWASRREGNAKTEVRRLVAAEILRKEIDTILKQDSKANIIVMGDFNDTPTNRSIHQKLRAKGQHELKAGENDLVNLLIEEEKNDQGTIVFHGDWMVFDQLIVSQSLLSGKGGLKVHRNNAFIIKDPRLLYTYSSGANKPNATFGGQKYYGGYSDHLPVYLTLEIQ